MVVLPLIHLICLHYVWAQVDAVSNSLEESSAKTSRGYQYYHEAIESDAAGDFNWRVWGGKAVSITQVPYAVLYGWTCGGSLIAPNWVITAAHCGKQRFIRAGSEISDNAQEYAISRHFFHPGWSSPKKHYNDFDFLLLKLSEPVPVTKRTRPIAIGGFEDLHAGQSVAISGWGYSENTKNITRETSQMSDSLRQVWMTVIDSKECMMHQLSPGDSGGPVVANNRLVGLVSWGPRCEPLQLFANIVKVKDWITKTTKLTL